MWNKIKGIFTYKYIYAYFVVWICVFSLARASRVNEGKMWRRLRITYYRRLSGIPGCNPSVSIDFAMHND